MLQSPVKILVIDDDRSVRDMLSIVLKREGYQIQEAENGLSALKKLKAESFDLVVSDIKMPDINGIELLKKVKALTPDTTVIMMTAYTSAVDAVEAMKLGAEDYISKPFNLEELKIVIRKSLRQKDIEKENVELRSKLLEREHFENIIGQNVRIRKIFDLIETVAKTDSTVLITGESGTGKELIARAIHNKSHRAGEKFISITCGALPENLLESELFGHKKGSFTDAYQDKEGLFKVADKGTLLLDEIAEMSQKMQVKLLRAIQERVIRRVGGNEEIKVDVRIIAATNKDPVESMQRGEFRADLYYRLNVISIHVPPLRERQDDIPSLMRFFLEQYNRKFNKAIEGFHPDVTELFLKYRWPGNVRELENFVERAIALEKGSWISTASLPAELIYSITPDRSLAENWRDLLNADSFDLSGYIDDISKKIVLRALEMNGWNVKNTAKKLQLSYRSLRYLIDKYKLKDHA